MSLIEPFGYSNNAIRLDVDGIGKIKPGAGAVPAPGPGRRLPPKT